MADASRNPAFGERQHEDSCTFMSWNRQDIHSGNVHIVVSLYAHEGNSAIDSTDMEAGRKTNLERDKKCIQGSDNPTGRKLIAENTRVTFNP